MDAPLDSDRPKDAATMLRDAALALDVEEILDLCYAFRNDFQRDPRRLIAYVDALRMKGSAKAQAAACLVCFDLARLGHPEAERDFLALVPVMMAFVTRVQDDGRRVVEVLVEDSPYLQSLLADLELRLRSADPRTDLSRIDEIVLDDGDALEVSLLSDDDFVDVEFAFADVDVDDPRFHDAWEDALGRFMGAPGTPDAFGFTAESRGALEAVERLRDDARSLVGHVDHANDMLPFIELFIASHMRARNLFGRKNRIRERSLKDGLAAFTSLKRPPVNVANWFDPPTAAANAWEKVADVLLDYVSFLGSLPAGSAPTDMPVDGFAAAYIAASRPQPSPPRLSSGDRRRR